MNFQNTTGQRKTLMEPWTKRGQKRTKILARLSQLPLMILMVQQFLVLPLKLMVSKRAMLQSLFRKSMTENKENLALTAYKAPKVNKVFPAKTEKTEKPSILT